MGFISNAERAKQTRKLHGHFGFKKWMIVSSLILGVLCAVYIGLGILGQLNVIKINDLSFVKNTLGEEKLTNYGIIACVIISCTLFFSLISVVLALSMRSPSSVSKTTLKLVSSALPGRRNNPSAAKSAKSRLGRS